MTAPKKTLPNLLSANKLKAFFRGPDRDLGHLFGESTGTVREADIVVFGGGADVLPHIWYPGTRAGSQNYYSPHHCEYDASVWADVRPHQLVVGICRGAQGAWCVHGGLLWQHIDNHTGRRHYVYDEDRNSFFINSAHHQQVMHPDIAVQYADANVKNFKLLLSARESTYKEGYSGYDRIVCDTEEAFDANAALDIEAYYLPPTDTLPAVFGFQAHPEWGHRETTDCFTELLDQVIQSRR